MRVGYLKCISRYPKTEAAVIIRQYNDFREREPLRARMHAHARCVRFVYSAWPEVGEAALRLKDGLAGIGYATALGGVAGGPTPHVLRLIMRESRHLGDGSAHCN